LYRKNTILWVCITDLIGFCEIYLLGSFKRVKSVESVTFLLNNRSQVIVKEPDMSDPQAKPKAVICTNTKLPPGVHNFEGESASGAAGARKEAEDPIKRVIYIDDRIIPGSFYVEAVWVVGSVSEIHPEHHHDHDEILGFVGSNMEDRNDLGAEIDFVLDGKPMTITKTCFIYVPAGVSHGGLHFRKIDRPVFQIAMLRNNIFCSIPPT